MKAFKKYFAIPLAAFIIYGSWAAFVNSEHGLDKWLPAGIAQGSYAFASTLIISETARKVYFVTGAGLKGILAGFISSFIIMLAIPVIIHNIIHTPDILEAILPGLIWGSFYLLGLLLKINQNAKQKTA